MNIKKLDNFPIDQLAEEAARIVNEGGIIIAPFDTVYGFITNPSDKAALRKVIELKIRKKTKIIGLAVDSIETIVKVATIDQTIIDFLKEKVPGKFTFILKDNGKNNISNLCKKEGTLGIRIPDNHLVLEIARRSGGIIAQTSANKSGLQNCHSIHDLENQFAQEELEEVNLIIDGGEIEESLASEIWNLTLNPPRKIER